MYHLASKLRDTLHSGASSSKLKLMREKALKIALMTGGCKKPALCKTHKTRQHPRCDVQMWRIVGNKSGMEVRLHRHNTDRVRATLSPVRNSKAESGVGATHPVEAESSKHGQDLHEVL
jgi:hypothetical protein